MPKIPRHRSIVPIWHRVHVETANAGTYFVTLTNPLGSLQLRSLFGLLAVTPGALLKRCRTSFLNCLRGSQRQGRAKVLPLRVPQRSGPVRMNSGLVEFGHWER
jgi:hypothetical protein